MNPADWGVDVAVSGYLLGVMAELGWAGEGVNGPTALSWAELRAYSDATGQNLASWEYRALRSMSEAFVEGFFVGGELDPARWTRYEGALIPFKPLKNETVELLDELEAGS